MDLSSFTDAFRVSRKDLKNPVFHSESAEHNSLLLKISAAVVVVTILLAIGIYFIMAADSVDSDKKNNTENSDPLINILSQTEEKIDKKTDKEVDKNSLDTNDINPLVDKEKIIETIENTENITKISEDNKFPSLEKQEKENKNLEDFFNDADKLIEEKEKERERESKKKIRSLPVEILLPEGITLEGSFIIASGGEEEPLDFPKKSIKIQPVLDLVILMELGNSVPFLASPVFGEQKKVVLSVDTTAIAYLSTSTGLYAEEISAEEKREILLAGVDHKKFFELQELTKKQVSRQGDFSAEIKILAQEIIGEVRE